MAADLQDLEQFDESIDRLVDFHRDTAKKIWPRGTVLRCAKCGRTQTATVGELATYLAIAWPSCHGETMRIGDAPRSTAEDGEDAEEKAPDAALGELWEKFTRSKVAEPALVG
jgi:hypothetical protein